MGGFNLGQLQQMLGQAKQQYEQLRQKMASVAVDGSAGGGMVTVRMNGEKQVLQVVIDPDVTRNDPDMLPDLICAAVNDASRQVDERMKSEFGNLMGLPLAGLF